MGQANFPNAPEATCATGPAAVTHVEAGPTVTVTKFATDGNKRTGSTVIRAVCTEILLREFCWLRGLSRPYRNVLTAQCTR